MKTLGPAKPLVLRSAKAKDGRTFARTADGNFQVSSTLGGGFMGSSFQAIKRAGWKGWFYLPDLVPARRMTPLTRDTINRAGQWLYDNVGFAGAIVDRTAIYEGGAGMWPKSLSTNPAFNKLNTEVFHQGVKDPRFFDLARVESFYSAQVSIRKHIRLYGDHFGQLVRGPIPRIRFIPGYWVRNPPGQHPQSDWLDGVKVDAFGAALVYCVWTSIDGKTWEEVPADDMLHFHDGFLTGQTRGMSVFARTAEKMFTIDDICRAEANGLLARAKIGYALTTPADDGGGGGPKVRLPGANQQPETVTNPDGSTFQIQRISFPGGDTMEIPELPAGYGIEVVESSRANSNEIAFISELKRDMSWGTGYMPEFLDFIADSGGAVTRFVLEDTQQVIDDKRLNQLEPQFCNRFYVFGTWQRIDSGYFDGIEGGIPLDWWKHRNIFPRRITVDKKNDGRLDDARLETGKMSSIEYHGQDGRDDEEVEDDVIATAIRQRVKVAAEALKAKIELSFEEVFRPPVGSAPLPEPEPPADTPPPKKTKAPTA